MKSKYFAKIKAYYDKGYWSIKQVYDAVIKERITADEYKEITGYDFDSGEDEDESEAE